MKPQPVSFLSQEIVKKNHHFSPVSRETGHKKKEGFSLKPTFFPKTGQKLVFLRKKKWKKKWNWRKT